MLQKTKILLDNLKRGQIMPTEQLSETNIDLGKDLEEIQRCYYKWKSPNISYISFLNHGERQRGNEAWEAIEKIAKDMGWEAGSHE
jgi:hypothetical protein